MASAKSTSKSPWPHPAFLLWTAFISGMSLMVVEINASRILAPYFGTSLFVWSNIIGIVLLALSLGYFWGGKVADRYPNGTKLYYLIFATATWLAILPWFSTGLLRATLSFPSSAVFGLSLFSALLLFFPPCTIMGMVSPYVLKLLSTNQKTLGQEAGRLSAISTLGSLIGTFLPVLVTIPTIGTLRTTLIFAALLFFTAALGLRKVILQSFTIVTLLLCFVAPAFLSNSYTVYSGESSYNFVHVYENQDNRFLQIDDPRAVHSIKMAQGAVTHNYWDYAAAIPFSIPTKNALVLGLAGGNISSLLHQYFPTMQIVGVEIDPLVVEIGKKLFDTAHPNMQIVTDDARNFLTRSRDKYDFIILDTYHNLSLPVHLTTSEFFALIKDHLTNTGTLAINVAHEINHSQIDSYLLATLAPHFQYLYSIDTNGGYNSLLIARNQPWPSELSTAQKQQIATTPELSHVWQKLPPEPIASTDPQKIQTDDKNILEWLSSRESIR